MFIVFKQVLKNPKYFGQNAGGAGSFSRLAIFVLILEWTQYFSSMTGGVLTPTENIQTCFAFSLKRFARASLHTIFYLLVISKGNRMYMGRFYMTVKWPSPGLLTNPV